MATTVWVDATAGIAGDMLAGALVDAGVPLEVMAAAVEAVLPGAVRLRTHAVQRAGLQATKLEVDVLEVQAPHRHLADIRGMVAASGLDASVRMAVDRVFTRLGAVEAAAHGVAVEAVHFHEVGAADSIADIVAVCAGLHWLGADDIVFSTVELGHGSVRAAHGRLPVPTPAALRLTEGCDVTSAHAGEMATPTGLALLTALGRQDRMPAMRLRASGMGAGSRDPADHANVVRVVLGDHAPRHLLLEANVDDMDPRLWPAALASLLQAGAQDAWVTPIVMKKGRPALTLSVLCTDAARAAVEDTVFRETTTIGLRAVDVEKVALDRGFAAVTVDGHRVAVKYAGRHGRIYNVSIEWDDVAAAAKATGRPQREVLAAATDVAAAAGFLAGAAFPAD